MTGMAGESLKGARMRVGVAAIVLTLAASPLAAACLHTDAGGIDVNSIGPAIGGGVAAAPSPVETSRAVRIFQTEMMVAGLSCGEKRKYDAFAARYRSTLVSNGDRLKKYFYERDGASLGFRKLNTFVTRIANETSGRIASSGVGYCAMATARFGELLSGAAVDLERYSTDRALALGAFDPPTPEIIQVATSDEGCDGAPDKVALTQE